jgi:DNA-binding MltR family transcriptional regulator
MAKRYEPGDMDAIFTELDGDSDRAAISVGGSLLEHAIETCVRAQLRDAETKPEREALVSDAGIIGSFYRKIWLAYFLKIIGPKTRQDFDLIRSIRNEVSHNMNPVSFDMPAIASRCQQLNFAKLSIPGQTIPPDLRGMFLLSIKFYGGVLQLKANEHVFGVKEALESLEKYVTA